MNKDKIKYIDIGSDTYIFTTLEELAEMLKEEEYEVSLHIRKKRKIKRAIFRLKL
ncbi:MAG: hypothetical protein ACRCX2_36905 [Paraclostridium sp.]